MILSTSIHEYSEDVAKTLIAFFGEQEVLARAVDPHLHTSLTQLRDFSLRGGKTLRPFLVSLAYQLAGGSPHVGLIKAAAATELHHKHILILDDIADRDETRYGGPTVEHAYQKTFKDIPEGGHRATSFAMLDSLCLKGPSKEFILEVGSDAIICL